MRLRMIVMLAAVVIGWQPMIAQAQNRKTCTQIDASSILTFSGGSSGYRLVRRNSDIGVALFAPLQSGDGLFVKNDAGHLSVQLPSGRIRRISHDEGWFCVRQQARPTPSSNAAAEMGRQATKRQDKGDRPSLTRGERDGPHASQGPIRLAHADLLDRTSRVVIGSRSLALAWYGGTPPFHVRIRHASGNLIVDEYGLGSHLLLLDRPRDLVAGTYEVSVTDARGGASCGSFVAVPSEAGNVAPPTSADFALIYAANQIDRGPTHLFDAFLALSPFFGVDETVGHVMSLIAEPKIGPSKAQPCN